MSQELKLDSEKLSLHKAASNLVLAKRKEVLLVEDTAPHAALLKRALAPEGWTIVHVTRAETALEEITKVPNQIVLLDLSLPDMDGLDLLSRIRSISNNNPVIVVTSTDQVRISVEAMQRGACDYVVKGDPDETGTHILAAVNKAWSQRLREAEDELIEQTKLIELVRAERLEAIELIVRTVCHEVNNPLSGAMALGQVLVGKNFDDPELRKIADGIVSSTQEIAQAIKKLSMISDKVIEFGGQRILDSEQ